MDPSPPETAARDDRGLAAREVERLARGAAVQLAGKIAGRGIGFAIQLMLAATLGPAAYGLFGLGWTAFQITGLAAALGLENGVVRFASRYRGADPARLGAVLRRSLQLALSSGVALGIAGFLAAPYLAGEVFQKPALTPVLRIFAAGLVLLAGARVAAGGTRVSQRMRYSTIAEDLVQPISQLLLLFAAALFGGGLLAAVAATAGSFGIAFLVAVFYLRALFPEISDPPAGAAPPVRPLLRFSVATAAAGMLSQLIFWTDRLLLGRFVSEADLGIYMVASLVASLFGVVLTAFNAIFSPMIADLYQKGDLTRLGKLFSISTQWGLYLCTPLFLVVLFFSGEMLTVLVDGRYRSGALPLVLLVSGQMINVGTGAVGFLLIMSGRQNRWLTLSVVTLVLNVVGNLLLIPRFGLTGAASATATALAFLFVSGLAGVRRSLGLWPYERRFAKGLVAALAAAGALALMRWSAAPPPLLHLALALAVAFGVFAATLLLTGIEGEDLEVLRALRTRKP